MKQKNDNLGYNNNNDFEHIKFLRNIVNDSCSDSYLDNKFIIFKSINNIFYLIYSNKKKSIIAYDIINNKKINEIKRAHNEYIINFEYNLDKINKRDLIISISGKDNNIKLWNINNFQCLLDIKNINRRGWILSSCFLNYYNDIYIVSSNFKYPYPEGIKIFDLNGKKIREIKNSKKFTESISFIDTFYDKNFNIYYIITGNYGYIKSYDYNENKLYHQYIDKDINYEIYNDNDIENDNEDDNINNNNNNNNNNINNNINNNNHNNNNNNNNIYNIEDEDDDDDNDDSDDEDKSYNIYSALIKNDEEVIKLIESNSDGNIKIWNFHSGELLYKIKISDKMLLGICLWNNDYLLIGSEDKSIKILDLNNRTIIKELISHNKSVNCIKKIILPIYGKCIISQGSDDQIKLWIYKD